MSQIVKSLKILNILKILIRKKVFRLFSVATVMVLIFCMVQFASSRNLHTYTGATAFTQGCPETVAVYDHLTLSPGIYEIVLYYSTNQDYSGICSVQDDTVHHRLLLTNGEHLYAGLGQTEYTMWLLEPAGDLRIMVDYGGTAYLETGDLIIRNTGKLWTVLFVGIFFGWCLVAGIGCLYTGVKERIIPRHTIYAVLGIAFITALASISQMGGYLLGGADLTYHLQRIEGVKDTLLSGKIFTRIEPEWLYGHGYANGIFYCDALLYFPALLRLAGFTITTSYNVYCICLNLSTACIAYYCFRRIFGDDRIGLMCSALYTLSIIRLYKLAIVGAVGEGSAITFLPLIFYGMYLIFGKREVELKAWLPLAIGYAGLMQTHVLTCEITAFLTVLICVICIRCVIRPRTFVVLVKGALGALGLSLWYLVPFLDYYMTQDMHIRHVSGRTIQDRGLHVIQLFVNTWTDSVQEMLMERGMDEVVPVSPGFVCLLALGIFFLWWCISGIAGLLGRHEKKADMLSGDPHAILRTAKLSALLACLLIFMTLRIFPWNRIQDMGSVPASLVSSLQFPNRFMGWAMVFLLMVFGSCLWYLQYVRKLRIGYLIGVALTVFSIATASWGLMRDAMAEDHRLYLYNEEGMGFGYISGAEYLIQGTDESKLTFAGAVAGEHINIKDYRKRYLKVWITCENTGEESYIDLPLMLYKGYRAGTAEGEELIVCDGDNHQVRVVVPAGFAGEFTVQFVSPFYWHISELITTATVCIILYWLMLSVGTSSVGTRDLDHASDINQIQDIRL